MKTKKFTKKMVLNKETVVNISSANMNHVKGGSQLPCLTEFPFTYCQNPKCVVDSIRAC